MTIEELNQRESELRAGLQSLMAQGEQIKANINATQGALQDVAYWRDKLAEVQQHNDAGGIENIKTKEGK